VAEPVDSPVEYPVFAVTSDVVVFLLVGGILNVVLVERGVEPFKGQWALPGGFKRPDESLDDAAARELREEVGFSASQLRQFGAFGDPGRDPRGNVVTVGYYVVINEVPNLVSGTDASDTAFWAVREVLLKQEFLAFDHRMILESAMVHLARELETSDLIRHLLPTEFRISELQAVYEQIWSCKLDPSNLRRSLNLKEEEWLLRVGVVEGGSGRTGRPAGRYRFNGDWSRGGPIRRPDIN
jgi:8-oxo-dGTP diphosphatase